MNKSYSKPPRKNYPPNKTDVYHIDDVWSFDLLDLEKYGPENKRGCRYVLVIIDNFSKISWKIPFKNENAQTMNVSFENILISSKRKPDLVATDQDRGFYSDIFQTFLNNNNIKVYSRILEIAHLVVSLRKDLIVLLEMFSKNLFLIRRWQLG